MDERTKKFLTEFVAAFSTCRFCGGDGKARPPEDSITDACPDCGGTGYEIVSGDMLAALLPEAEAMLKAEA